LLIAGRVTCNSVAAAETLPVRATASHARNAVRDRHFRIPFVL
jgi:hypothetical protein